MNATQLVNAQRLVALHAKQLVTWPLAAKNYEALRHTQSRRFEQEGFEIRVQFNPARAISSGAKVDARSIEARPCFLCPDHLPKEQLRLPFGERYLILCNPYPIFPLHFTIPTIAHTPQRILPRIGDFLELTRQLAPLTLFYNGPKSGASAPDHAHFQAVSRGLMPLDEEIPRRLMEQEKTGEKENLLRLPEGEIHTLTGYWRNGLIIRATTKAGAETLFRQAYEVLPLLPDEPEPSMNLFGSYLEEGCWILTLIPRKRHRPWQYEATGEDKLLSSPGAADVGGLFITPREEDFRKINPELLRDVYQQVCLNDSEIQGIFTLLKALCEASHR